MNLINCRIQVKSFLDYLKSLGLPFEGGTYDFNRWLFRNQDAFDKKGIHFDFGASKFVFWTDSTDYVIKMPYYDDCKDCENKSRDYCKIEARNYRIAVKENCAEYFAPSFFLFVYGTFPIYVMEKVDCDCDEISSQAYECAREEFLSEQGYEEDGNDDDEGRKEAIYAFEDSYYDLRGLDQLVPLLVENYGGYVTHQIEMFCYQHNINDLHCGNWGYNSRGNLVMVDYSGYNG